LPMLLMLPVSRWDEMAHDDTIEECITQSSTIWCAQLVWLHVNLCWFLSWDAHLCTCVWCPTMWVVVLCYFLCPTKHCLRLCTLFCTNCIIYFTNIVVIILLNLVPIPHLWNCQPLLFIYGSGQPQPAAKHNLGLAVGVVGLSTRLLTWWQTPTSPRSGQPGWLGPGSQTRPESADEWWPTFSRLCSPVFTCTGNFKTGYLWPSNS
jgi:hypothetical protein